MLDFRTAFHVAVELVNAYDFRTYENQLFASIRTESFMRFYIQNKHKHKKEMISQREQQLISDALRVANLTELPKKADKKTVWIEGVAKITLADGSTAYGIVKRNPDLTHRVAYVNGNTAAIAKVEEVYPYVTLNSEYIKKFGKNDGEEARIKYLRSLNLPCTHPDLSEMTLEELNKEVVKAAVYMQQRDMSK